MSKNILNYIYLLQTRESFERNDHIFKLGRTTKTQFERFNQYPKGSILYLQIKCIDCVSIETHLLKVFKETFKQCDRCDRCNIYGSEYFKGDPSVMINIILQHLKYSCDIENNHDIEQKFRHVEDKTNKLKDELALMKTKYEKVSNDLSQANRTMLQQQKKFNQDCFELNNKLLELQLQSNDNVDDDVDLDVDVDVDDMNVVTVCDDDDSLIVAIESLHDVSCANNEENVDLKYQCHKCKVVLCSNQSLDRHLKLCQGVNSLQCPKCCKEFTTAQGKYKHIKHVKCKIINPHYCPTIDSQNDTLQNENSLKCHKCDQLFVNKYTLRNHVLKCNGVHSLQCDQCMKVFTSYQGKYHHNKNVKCIPINQHYLNSQ